VNKIKRWVLETIAIFAIMLIVTVITMSSSKAGDMDKGNFKREAVWQLLNIIDWRQTRVVQKDSRFYEGGWILDKNPTMNQVNGYFLTMAFIHFGAINLLPKAWKKPVEMGMLTIKTGTVLHNYSVGVRFEL